MNILVIKNAEWNDVTFANNLLTNWFEGVNANIANVYCGPGMPLNNICKRYFQITESQLLKSLFFGGRAGEEIPLSRLSHSTNNSTVNANRRGVYGFFKKLSLIARTPVMLIRDLLWMRGRYNKAGLRLFIESFKPNIILSYRVFSPQIYKLERLVFKYADAPMVAYTGDDEIWNDCYPRFGISQLRKKYTRFLFAKQSSLYSYYFTHSADLCKFYSSTFGIPSTVVYKGGVFSGEFKKKEVHSPIKMVYAGRICYGRWKTIVEIGKCIDLINSNEIRMQFLLYTQDTLSKKELSLLKGIKSIKFCGAVSSNELVSIYERSDIALHIESFERKYSQVTVFSFSTKIVDLMNSTCAILAVCDENQSGFKYLKENNAAFTVSSFESLYDVLLDIVNNPSRIGLMAKNAWKLGKTNHDKSRNQEAIMALLTTIADEKHQK